MRKFVTSMLDWYHFFGVAAKAETRLFVCIVPHDLSSNRREPDWFLSML